MECHPALQSKDLTIGQCMFYFVAENFIPWIWKWSVCFGYNKVEIPYLYRTFHGRWWAQWPIQETLKLIDTKLSQFAQLQSTNTKIIPSMDLHSLRRYLEKKHPAWTEEQVMQQCMTYLKLQFSSAFCTTFSDKSEKISIRSDDDMSSDAQPPQSIEEVWDDVEKTLTKGKGRAE